MSWRDREGDDDPYRGLGRPGGDWQGVRPTLDNPMSWSLFLMRFSGIAVRIHIVFVLYIVIQLVRSLARPADGDPAPLGFGLAALSLGCLFLVVLLHEFGHCFACRWSGGASDEILMWPLGGLAFCRPAQAWQAHLITAVGGPMVNVVIFVILAPTLGLLTGRWLGVALPNPLAPIPFFEHETWWLLTLYLLHDVSFILLLFNLLPIFPLDGGRICQAVLWPRVGYVRSMRLAVYTGYFGAIALGIFGAVMQQWILVGIAFFGGITCYVTLKQVQFTESFAGDESPYAASLWGEDDAPDAGPSREEQRAERKKSKQDAVDEVEAEHLDRILEKIGEHGVGSLNARERGLLKRATERKRRDGR